MTENRGQVGRVRLLDGHLISDVAGTAADGFGRVEKALAWLHGQTSSIIGAVCAVVVGAIGLVWHSPAFGVVVAASMFTSANLSGAAGTAIPMLSKRLGFDPAVTAGPVETALQDVFGVTIFLALATALLRWLT